MMFERFRELYDDNDRRELHCRPLFDEDEGGIEDVDGLSKEVVARFGAIVSDMITDVILVSFF